MRNRLIGFVLAVSICLFFYAVVLTVIPGCAARGGRDVSGVKVGGEAPVIEVEDVGTIKAEGDIIVTKPTTSQPARLGGVHGPDAVVPFGDYMEAYQAGVNSVAVRDIKGVEYNSNLSPDILLILAVAVCGMMFGVGIAFLLIWFMETYQAIVEIRCRYEIDKLKSTVVQKTETVKQTPDLTP